jgi:IS5 family transposase
VVCRRGIPLAVKCTGANIADTTMLEAMVDAIPALKGKGRRGRPRKRPGKVHADKGYDSKSNRQALRKRGIRARIARRGVESSEKLGRHRWVVERTLAWLNRFRRLTVRYERRLDIHEAFLRLGCALICCNYLNWRFC